MVVLTLATVGMGAMFASAEVAMVAFCGQHGTAVLSGVVLAAFALGSATVRPRGTAPARGVGACSTGSASRRWSSACCPCCSCAAVNVAVLAASALRPRARDRARR